MWMVRVSSPSTHSEGRTTSLWCRSAIRAWASRRSKRIRSSMPSSPPNLTEPAWDFASADLLWNRMAAAFGLPTTLRAVQAFTSPFPPKSRLMNDSQSRLYRFKVGSIELIPKYDCAAAGGTIPCNYGYADEGENGRDCR